MDIIIRYYMNVNRILYNNDNNLTFRNVSVFDSYFRHFFFLHLYYKMENIVLQINEPISVEQRLTDRIDESCSVLLYKINLTQVEIDEYATGKATWTTFESLIMLKGYLHDAGVTIVYASCGVHYKGENQRPHIHYHLIIRNKPSGIFISANSTHRNRWFAKADAQDRYGHTSGWTNITVKMPKKLNPVWSTLAYPFKEGHAVRSACLMNDKEFDFLMAYGKNLYEVSCGNRARQDACDDRKKVALNNLAKLCRDNKDKFSTYAEMIYWLDDNFIDLLPIDEKPDLRQYTSNCQKIGNELKLFKYSSLVLGKR